MAKKKATIQDVAKLAGVSVSTAGRVIGEYGYVSEEKRQLVNDAIISLSYTPNVMAQSLRTSHMKTVGIVLGDIKNPFFSRLLSSIENCARKYGYSTIVCNTNDLVEQEVQMLKVLYSKRVDGIILVPAYKIGQCINPEYFFLYEGDIPVVFADRDVMGTSGSVVSIDNWQGGYDGMEYLLQLGHRQIGIVAPPQFITVEDRIAGCLAATEKYRMEFDCKYLFRFDGDRAALSKWLDESENITAIFTLNSDALSSLVEELNLRKKRIPNDISLLCWDDCEIARFIHCSVVEQPVAQMGAVAVERLMLQIKKDKHDKQKHEEVSLKAQLIIRDSCQAPSKVPL